MKKLKYNKWFLLVILVIVGLFYWFQIRPAIIRKICYQKQLQVIQKRHDDNVNYYFVWTGGGVSSERELDAGKNKPMYVKDLNARLDVYWGNIAYTNCLREKGLK